MNLAAEELRSDLQAHSETTDFHKHPAGATATTVLSSQGAPPQMDAQ